jgi:hypothetical protein
VTISRPFKQVLIKAYLSGIVTEVLPSLGCVVETAGVRLTGAFGLGRRDQRGDPGTGVLA